MKSEGLYRVSGFSEHIEDVRLSFDRGLLITNVFASVLLSLDFKYVKYILKKLCVSYKNEYYLPPRGDSRI